MQCAHLIGKVLFLHTLHEHHQSLQSRPPGKAQVLSKLLTIKKNQNFNTLQIPASIPPLIHYVMSKSLSKIN